MDCERCGEDLTCSPVNGAIAHEASDCVASLRQQLAALTLRVEALEEREVAELDAPDFV